MLGYLGYSGIHSVAKYPPKGLLTGRHACLQGFERDLNLVASIFSCQNGVVIITDSVPVIHFKIFAKIFLHCNIEILDQVKYLKIYFNCNFTALKRTTITEVGKNWSLVGF